MRRFALLLLAVLVWTCPGCGASTGRSDELRLWTGMADSEFPALQEVVKDFTARTGTPVQLLKVPFDQLRNKYLIAAPADLGPDLLMGPQDWVGVLATAGLLDPVPAQVLPRSAPEGDYMPVAIEAVSFERQVYAVPLFTECVALIRNPELVSDAPVSLPDLVEKAVAVQQKGGGVRGFYYDIENLYFSWAFFSAHGAYIFGKKDGVTDPFDVGLATPGAVQAAGFLRSLRLEHGLIAPGAKVDIAKSLYLDGKAALIIDGPWLLGDLQKSGVPYSIDPFPPTEEGGLPRPFVTVQGVMLNARSPRKDKAAELMAHLASDDSLVRLAHASGRAPTRKGALDKVSADSPDIAAFARIAETGTPMSSHPAMSAVWGPMQQALELITNGTREPEPQLEQTTRAIEQKIRLMME